MNKEFENKKLLILGATPNEIPLVRRAQELGIYVIVTDYNTDYKISPAKYIADECWDISWSELDTLEEKCREIKVDGVLAGYSEIRVDNMIQLCKRLGLHSFANESQLAVTRDKIKFKNLCRQYGVSTVREYESIEHVNKFPVIVKPTDRAGSIGISIAYNREELLEAYNLAIEKSLTKQVIIEEYITDATEMDVHYVVQDGEIFLLSTDDIIQAVGNKADGKVVQSAWVYPSKYENIFLEKEDGKLRNLIKGLGIYNGTIFFSAFADEQGEVSLFECGFRLWGEQEFNYAYQKGNVNYLDIYIYHALQGTACQVKKNDNESNLLKGVSLNLYVKGGVINKIHGMKHVEKMENCCLCITDAYIGQECSFDNAILTKAGLIGFANVCVERLKDDVDEAYRNINILDCDSKDMLYDQINTEFIITWWN